MEVINTKRIWEIFNIFEKIEEENEDIVLKYNIFNTHTYEDFLTWWSFKIDLERKELINQQLIIFTKMCYKNLKNVI